MLVFSKVREFFVDSLELKLDIEEIKRRLANQDKNLELVFTYLDELIEKQKSPPPRRQIGTTQYPKGFAPISLIPY